MFLLFDIGGTNMRLAWDTLPTTRPDRRDAARFLFQKIRPGTKLWTDGASIYRGIGRWWPVQHSRDIHRKFEFAHTSEVEGIIGTYRAFVRRSSLRYMERSR